ncbi:MAG: UDP-N-acetylglucosamine--N-acetylmuramyl-(pentapeptide) pyrophosphoryl-undecaprenol N-acetylglucosamine transferase, partial [Bacteroidetes bacterium]
MSKRPLKILISGGGTGGHVFPAIAIAHAIRRLAPDSEILFVGAQGRMEMEQVPKAGFAIEGLWISGFQRRLTWQNLLFPVKLASSLARAWHILRRFQPDVVVGVGGYASGPVLEVATRMGLPTLIQEQNSYPGATNRLLAPRVDRICVAWPGMERWFPEAKVVRTGNPVRREIAATADPAAARAHFGLDPHATTVLVTGGSLGARSLNEAMMAAAAKIGARPDVQWLWQTGRLYAEACAASATAELPQVRALPFVDRMDLAWAAA